MVWTRFGYIHVYFDFVGFVDEQMFAMLDHNLDENLLGWAFEFLFDRIVVDSLHDHVGYAQEKEDEK